MSLMQEEPPPTTGERALAEKWRCSSAAAGRFLDRLLVGLSRETSSGRFIPEMDGLRFLETCMVVLVHLHIYLIAKSRFYEHGVANRDWLNRAVWSGSHAIELFFVISAFMLALPFAAHRLKGAPAVDLRKYYLRRLTRLEPPYVVSLFLLMFLTFLFSAHSLSGWGPHLAASLFYLHNLIYGAPSTVLCVAWSLEIEVQFYMLVPLLTLLFAVRHSVLRRGLIVLLAVLAIAVQAGLRQLGPRFALSVAGNLQFFLIGFLLADVFLLEWKTAEQRSVYWDAVTFLGWPALLISLQSETQRRWLFPALIFVVYCAALRGRSTIEGSLQPLDNDYRRDVLFHLLDSLRRNFCRWPLHQADRRGIAESFIFAAPVRNRGRGDCLRLWRLFPSAGKAMYEARLAAKAVAKYAGLARFQARQETRCEGHICRLAHLQAATRNF